MVICSWRDFENNFFITSKKPEFYSSFFIMNVADMLYKVSFLVFLSIFFSFPSFSKPIDSCEIILKGFKRTDGFIIFRNSQNLEEDNLNPIGLTGLKEKKLLIPCPIMFYKADNTAAPFFLKPNDTLIITKTNDDYSFQFINNPIRTNEQNLLWKIFKEFGPIYGFESNEYKLINKQRDKPLSTSDREILKTLYENRIKVINNFKKSNPISEYFELYIKKYFYYLYLSSSLKNFLNLTTVNSLPTGLYREINQFKEEDEKMNSLLQIDSYRGFLNSYNYLIKKISNCTDHTICELKKISENFKFSSADYLLFQEMKAQLNTVDDSTTFCIDYFYKECKNKQYIEIIKDKYALINEVGKNAVETFIVDQKLQKYNLAQFLAANKNKIVLLDFWASWCSPCMEEFKWFQDLISKYSSEQNLISFLFISMDKSQKNWEMASEKFKFLDGKTNFLLEDNFKSVFSKKYKINTIPRIIIIGKDGTLLSLEAPPNQEDFKNLIDKLVRTYK